LPELKNLDWINLGKNQIIDLKPEIMAWGIELRLNYGDSNGIILADNPFKPELAEAIRGGRRALNKFFSQTEERDNPKPNAPSNHPVVNPAVIEEPKGSESISQTTTVPSITKKKILILAANPINTSRLRFDEEIRDIEEALKLAKHRDGFEVKSKLAIKTRDPRREIIGFEPHIIHFIGHGGKDGLFVEGAGDKARFYASSAMAGLLDLFSEHVECVILNACFTAEVAKTIKKSIPYVIGMPGKIMDKAAIEFSVGFYDSLGAGHSIHRAFNFGCSAIFEAVPEYPKHLKPVLI